MRDALTKPRLNEGGPDKRSIDFSSYATPHFGHFIPAVSSQVVRCSGCTMLLLPGLGIALDGRERLRSFRFRFCASSCFFFFFTEGLS